MKPDRNDQSEAVFEAVAGSEKALGGALLGLEVGACLRRLPGRETFLVDLAEPGAPRVLDVDGDAVGLALDAELPVVVKRFGASDAREARAELLRGKLPRSPAQREAENLAGLLSAGLPVPQPYLFCESGASSLVVLEYLPHSATLRSLIEAGAPEAEPLSWDLAVLVAHMHDAGWYHRDLYLEHVVVMEDGELALLDAGRARHAKSPRSRWFVKDLAALSSSAPLAMKAERLRFAAHYFAALEDSAISTPRNKRAKRRFLARVERRAAGMRAHVPRHVHAPSPGPALGPAAEDA